MNRGIINIMLDEKSVNLAPFPTFALNRQGNVIAWNDFCENYFGYSFDQFTNDEIKIEESLFSSLSTEDFKRILVGKESLRFEDIQFITNDESLINATIVTSSVFVKGEPAILVTCLLNETFTLMNDDTQALKDLKNGLFSSFMMVTLDSDGLIIKCNKSFLNTSHWTPKRVIGKSFWQLFPDTEASKATVDSIWKTMNAGEIWQGEVEKITKGGIPYWVYLTAIPTLSPDTQKPEFILIEKDVTQTKQLQEQLEKIAYIDPETGLMNVHRLENIVNEMIEENRHFSFVYLSIDKYYTLKELHNKLGRENNITNEFTKRMKIYFQDSFMARINENEFVVITPLGDWFIQGFLSYLKQNPIYDGNTAIPLSISGGITRSPQDQSTFSHLMKASIATISNVRKAGGDSIVTLSTATHKAINRKAMVEKRLLLALNKQNLKVLYQPQLDLNTDKIIGVEALVRWEDEEIGVVTPDELIPIAEETGLINNIGSFVIQEACNQAAQWHSEGLDLKISINLSVREFRDKNMAKSILKVLENTNCPPELIQIEITEKFALEAEAETSIIKQMRTLEEAGIVFVLDDFGTGYASFRYMQLLPINILKIDQMFINSLLKSEKAQRLVHGMVQFGKSMNLSVLAEGVETSGQQQQLKDFGCDAIQGYLISKPITHNQITDLIKQN